MRKSLNSIREAVEHSANWGYVSLSYQGTYCKDEGSRRRNHAKASEKCADERIHDNQVNQGRKLITWLALAGSYADSGTLHSSPPPTNSLLDSIQRTALKYSVFE